MAAPASLDPVDARILQLLQENARISNAEIARKVKMADSAILERIRKLEKRGVISGYRASLNAKALGAGLVAFIFVRTEEQPGAVKTSAKLQKVPEVLEIHHVAGEDCFLLKVRTADTESLGRLLREKIGTIATVRSTRTTIVLETLKETNELRVPEVDRG